jgi:hypothetical protein
MKMSEEILLPFSKENLLILLDSGSQMESSEYSHKQIAEWCEKNWNVYAEIDPPKELEHLLPILADIETQWDLYLVNTYSLQELNTIDLDSVCMPKDWFINWAVEINA